MFTNNRQVTDYLELLTEKIQILVANTLKECINKLSTSEKQGMQLTHDEFLSAKEAANFLKIKLNTIYAKVERREISFYRSGKRKLLFSKRELEMYIKERNTSVSNISNDVNKYLQENRYRIK